MFGWHPTDPHMATAKSSAMLRSDQAYELIHAPASVLFELLSILSYYLISCYLRRTLNL